MLAYILAAVVAVLALVLIFLAGHIAAATGIPVSIITLLILALAVGAIVAILLLRKKLGAKTTGAGSKSPEAGSLDDLLREAEGKLAASQRTSAKSLRNLPLLYILGDENTAKTTAVLKSGLEPELLAGQIYRDKDVIPTPLANIWFTEKAAIVEAGQAIRKDAALWTRLIARTRPAAARSAFGAGAPFRAAVVCVTCDQFLSSQTTEQAQAAAAQIGERLRELARLNGTQLPVYVLLTKVDRVPGFADYVRNLSFDEGTQLLGVAPPAVPTSGYVETATGVVSAAYDELVFSLASARLDLLARENEAARLGLAYEFPRELRRFRNQLTSYLVELTRPSHLDVNPYLRGFYFTGVRAQMRQQTVSSPVAAQQAEQFDPNATSVFSVQRTPAPAPRQPAYSTTTEKVAQWTFLNRFFPHTILEDKSALANTAKTNHATLFRRVLYGTLAAILLIYLGLLTISYFNNAALERQIESASSALASSPSNSGVMASSEQLALLDSLRLRLLQLEDYRVNGAPTMYRWGLYRGDLLLDPARKIYFNHFRGLLLNRTQSAIVTTLDALPAAPPPGAEYNGTYNALRGYLITTSHPEKSKADFLTPVLLQFWQAGAPAPSADQLQLAQKQFDFYANELPVQNPYNIQPTAQTVTHARSYLASFGGIERIYQSMLTAAEKAGPAINFNAQHPHSAETVVEPHIIQSAFTKPGFAFMQDALAHPDRYFSGEAWVLGDQAPPSIDLGPVRQQLSARYISDYLAQWRAFLKDAQVVHYRDLKDAGARLTVLSGNNSPLLALLATISQNTTVANPDIANAFQAPQALVPGTSNEVYIGPSNKSYVDALLALNGAISGVVGNPAGASDPAAAMPISTAASAAHLAAQQSAQAFHIDPQAHADATTLALMEAPIASAEALVRGIGPAAANAGGKSFCAVYTALFAKVPFNPNGAVQASPAEITAVFQPGSGSLWQFYNSNLKAILVQQGSDYVQAPNAPMQVNPAFAHFFSRAAQVSQEFFPPGATGPSLTFVLRNLPSNGIQTLAIKVDSQSLTNTETSKQFNWTAQTASSASLTANTLPLQFSGPWSVFQLFAKGKSQKTGAGYELSFPLEVANTPVKGPDGTPVVAKFELSGPGADILAPGVLGALHCVPNVATK
jgi:type VI secretion system protein ImpL